MADDDFEGFVRTVDPQLRRALSGHLPQEQVADAIAEAFAYAWQHWARVQEMDNAAGYLFRVAQSKSRARKEGFLPWRDDDRLPEFEPTLIPALQALTPTQSRAVWLVHGCGWSYAETATALGISPSTVGTHVSRALDHLRERLGVSDGA
jgi:DNA-directed RNA polymerase specialized sigma24 family protein